MKKKLLSLLVAFAVNNIYSYEYSNLFSSINNSINMIRNEIRLNNFRLLIADYDSINKTAVLLNMVLTSNLYDYELLEMLLIYSTQLDLNDRKAFNNNSPINLLLINTRLARWEKISALRLLINRGADVNGYDALGDTPLYYAMRNQNHCSFVRLLLKNGADINLQNDAGYTPLMCAISCHKKYFLEDLINIPKIIADLRLKNQAGLTALDMLIDANRYDLFKKVSRHDRYKNQFKNINLLARAIEKKCKLEIIREIISLMDKNEINKLTNSGQTALILAINYDRLEVVKLLIKAGAEPEKVVFITQSKEQNKKEINFKEISFGTEEISINAKELALKKNNKKMINYFKTIGV